MSKQSIGKQTPTAYYIHVSQLSLLSNEEQATIIKGLDQAGLSTDSEFNVLKLSNDLSSLSFLNYPEFFPSSFSLEHTPVCLTKSCSNIGSSR